MNRIGKYVGIALLLFNHVSPLAVWASETEDEVQSSTSEAVESSVDTVEVLSESSEEISAEVESEIVSIEITNTTSPLSIGEKFKLEYTVETQGTPEMTYDWISSNPEIVSVDKEGNIEALGSGEATITLSVGDKEASVLLVVQPEITTIQINEIDLQLNVAETGQLSYVVSPSTAAETKEAVWSSSQSDVVSVDANGLITAVKEGVATVTVTIGAFTDSVTVTVNNPLPVFEIQMNKEKVLLGASETEKVHLVYSNLDERVKSLPISWSSSDNNVATIGSDGTIRAQSVGETTIIAKVEGKTATVNVVVSDPSVIYSTHIQSVGWQGEKKDGELSGTEGEAKRLEAIKVSIENLPFKGGVEYQTHVQSFGWMNWEQNGQLSGTEGLAKRLEGIRIKLTGEVSEYYDIYYRVHAQSYGWLDWAKNGEAAGTEGLAKRLEAIEIQLVKKGEVAPGSTATPYVYSNPVVSYTTHVQKQGWKNYVTNGEMSGTSGEALRLEAVKLNVSDLAYTGGIEYRTNIQSQGWQDWKSNNELSGTEGLGLRLEAIGIRLTGKLAENYDVYYRVHSQKFGWLDWAKNGESAGTVGLDLRLESLEVLVVKKGDKAPGNTKRPYVFSNPSVNYTTHVQKVGWQRTVSNGQMSGTSGQSLRLEGILINTFTQSLTGSIQYRTHVQKEGWQDWKENWEISGTQGKARRLEAVEIRLTDEMAQFYDVYYRVHAQSYGWLDWAKNGESAGTEGLAKRLEGIEIKLVRKGEKAPGSTIRSYVKK